MIVRNDDPMIRVLNAAVRVAVRLLAAVTVLVTFEGLAAALMETFHRFGLPELPWLTPTLVVQHFGNIMTTLIAIELFGSLTLLLQDERAATRMVLATALTALARKLIVLDYSYVTVGHLGATAAALIALAIGYRLTAPRSGPGGPHDRPAA